MKNAIGAAPFPALGEQTRAPLFPIFLALAGRHCLVAGAGTVGQPKIESLLRAGPRVCVVAPRATPLVRSWARSGRLRWHPREFCARDLDGAFLVVGATASPRVHQRILRLARRRGVLCNIVDDPARCDFFYPSVVRRGDLQIAVSTAGSSPALAMRLRKELERQFGPEYTEWLAELRAAREKLRERETQSERRRTLSHRMAGPARFAEFVRTRRLRCREAPSA